MERRVSSVFPACFCSHPLKSSLGIQENIVLRRPACISEKSHSVQLVGTFSRSTECRCKAFTTLGFSPPEISLTLRGRIGALSVSVARCTQTSTRGEPWLEACRGGSGTVGSKVSRYPSAIQGPCRTVPTSWVCRLIPSKSSAAHTRHTNTQQHTTHTHTTHAAFERDHPEGSVHRPLNQARASPQTSKN